MKVLNEAQYKVGDRVWHLNQMKYFGRANKPFRILERIVYASGNVDYIIKLGMVTMLVNAGDLYSVEEGD